MKKKLIIGVIILICLIIFVAIISICDLINSIQYHYGTYGGAVVFEDNTECVIQAVTWDSAAGYIFYSPNGYIMDVWYMGRTYSLSEAYRKGLLSKDDIEDIYNRYISRYPERAEKNPINTLEKLVEEMEEEYKKLYQTYYDNLSNEEKLIVDAYNNGNASTMGCIKKYYCELENGAVVVDMEIMHSSEDQAITEIKIADLIFSFTDTATSIEVLYNGKFYPLELAYENGIVSYDELIKIHEIHNNKQ